MLFKNYELLDHDAVLAASQKKHANLYREIKRGVFPPAVHLGRRQARWLRHELDAVILARIAGYPEDQLRELVSRLVAERGKVKDA